MVKVFNPLAENIPYMLDIISAMERVLYSGSYILGEELENFEKELASYLGVKHVIGVASGTDALVIALQACNIGQGDEVITTPLTFVATASAILRVGARPVFADISLRDFNLDPDSVARCITPKTRAIIPVHLYGHPAPMRELTLLAEEHGILIIEDVAQALGSEVLGKKAGSLGVAAAFSFYPTKILGGYGDGGAIATNHDAIAERARVLRCHGFEGQRGHVLLGYNSRLDELQAAALRVKLSHLEEAIQKRRSIASIYTSILDGSDILPPMEKPDVRHVYGLYTVRHHARDELIRFLNSHGIECRIYYPRPLFKEPLFREYSSLVHGGQKALRACREILSLPMHSGLTCQEVDLVCNALRGWALRERSGT